MQKHLYPSENVPANEFLNLESDKISTSRNWAVWLHEYLTDFPGKQDVLQVFTLRKRPLKQRTTTSHGKSSRPGNNNELVAILGNFVNRTLVLTNNYYEVKCRQGERQTRTTSQFLRKSGYQGQCRICH